MLKTYMSTCLKGLNQYSEDLCYTQTNQPVYRGIATNTLQTLNDYEIGSIGLWP